MTIDEAIKHAEEVAEKNEKQADKWQEEGGEKWGKTTTCRECAREHHQLAEWLKELKQLREQVKWIPMVRREPTEEEKAEFLVQNGEELCYMLENEMPLSGQEVLVSIGEFVAEDVFDENFFNFESNDIENVDAWMPKPKAYNAESEDA